MHQHQEAFSTQNNNAMFILGYHYWEATSKFRGGSVCIEGMIYQMSQDFRGGIWEFSGRGISPPNSSEINTVTMFCSEVMMIKILNTPKAEMFMQFNLKNCIFNNSKH